LLLRIIVNAFAALIGGAIIPGIEVSSVGVAIIFALVFGLLNATLGNIMKFFGCLINLLTFGIFNWIVNAIIINLAGKWVDGIHVSGFWPALFLGLLMAFVSSFVFNATDKRNKPKRK